MVTAFDGMALVQKVSVEGTHIVCGSLAASLMAMVLLDGLDSNRINFFPIQESSSKNTESSTRGEVAWSGSSEHNRPTAD